MKQGITIGYPLVNFKSEVDSIFISNQLEIKRITVVSEPVEIMEMLLPEMKETVHVAKIKGSCRDSIIKGAYALVTGLRLFKSGPVGLDDYHIESELSPSNLSKEKIPNLFFLKPSLEVSGSYHLLENEVEHLQSFLEKFFTSGPMKRHLSIAIHRFNTGIQGGNLEAKFLDFIIALETIYLSGEGELRYRLANRTASLIGKEGDRLEVFKQVMSLYKLRCEVLHQGKFSHGKFEKATQISESLVRKSLLSALALRQKLSITKLRTKLDECLHRPEMKTWLQNEVEDFWEDITFPPSVQEK